MSENKLYLVFDSATGLTKIGKTTNFGRRLKEYQALNPGIIPLFCFPFREGENTEKKIQEIYSKYCCGGEWFNLKKHNIIDIAAHFADLSTERAQTFLDDLNHCYEE